MLNRLVQIREQRLVVSQNHDLLLRVLRQFFLQHAQDELAAVRVITHARNHGAEFRIAAIIVLRLVERGVIHAVIDGFYYHAVLRRRLLLVHHIAQKHFEHFGEPVLALHGARQPQRVQRGHLHHALTKHFGAHVVHLVKHREAEAVKHVGGVLLHGERLQHAEHDVLVVNVHDLTLDAAHARAGQELLNSLYPLIH